MIVGTRGSLNPTAYTVLSTQLGPTLQVCASWKITTLFSMMVTVNTFHAIMSLYFSFQTSKDTPFSFCQAVNICKVVMNHRQWPLLIKLEKNLKRLQIRTPGIALNCRTEWSFWGVEYVTLCSYVHVLGIKPLLNPSGSWKIARAHYTERHFQPDKCIPSTGLQIWKHPLKRAMQEAPCTVSPASLCNVSNCPLTSLPLRRRKNLRYHANGRSFINNPIINHSDD